MATPRRVLTLSEQDAALRKWCELVRKLRTPPSSRSVLRPQVKDNFSSSAKYLGASGLDNILPLEGPGSSNLLELPEVKAAREVLEVPGTDADIFVALETAFGFQCDNVRNQREHLVLLLANTLSQRLDKKDLDETIEKVFEKILGNYENWCLYLRHPCTYNREMQDKEKVAFMALYLCIWGEAANVRFLPECICYIFHNMAGELKGKLPSFKSGQRESGRLSFLEEIITPIYEALQKEAKKSNNGKAAHSKWRNYDDFNEFFWSKACFRQRLEKDQNKNPFFHHKTGGEQKTSFVEHRTFLHLYHSFVRVWILLFMMLQGLLIWAFTKNFSLMTWKIMLSLGPTYFVMKLIESVLDIVLMIGAYLNTRGDAIVRIFFQFSFYAGCAGGLSYLYWKMYWEKAPNNFFLRFYLWVLGSYVVLKLLISLFQHIPSVRQQVQKMGNYGVFEAFVWLFKEHFYVGRGLYEKPRDYIRYLLFWVTVLACKFTFSYFFQIKPLADATKIIFFYEGPSLYDWHDFVSKNNHNALALFFLWAPVVLVYLLDIQIWYIVISAILGGVIGAKDRLGEIRSLDMLRNRFKYFPEAFVKNLQPENHQDMLSKADKKDLDEFQKEDSEKQIADAYTYAPFWNDIIDCLREEDYITNHEKDLLTMPTEKTSTTFVQWPLFLLASKVSLAMKLVAEKKESPKAILEKLRKDKYMSSAVAEAFEIVHSLLIEMVVSEQGKEFFENVFKDVKESIKKGEVKFFSEFPIADHIENIYKKVTDLTQLLIKDKQPQDDINKAVQNIFEAVLHILPPDLKRKQYKIYLNDAARDFFESNNSPLPKMRDSISRLHLLLTTTESGSSVPRNGEAQRRLQFFTNSLFMRMPPAPSVRTMKSFSLLTPYYNEIVMFSLEDLKKENEDGISILFYLKTIFPDEWENFLKRKKIVEKALMELLQHLQQLDPELELDLRLWASYRGQTLARTVRGMMYYRKALILQASRESSGPEGSTRAMAESFADLKFTYVVSCQIYGQQKASPRKEDNAKANDILHLLRVNEGLRVAFIDTVDGENGKKSYSSKLIKSGADKNEQVIYTINLPGNPMLGEGKPENQNHAIIFTRGEALQTIDMNQDNYFEEALKMRNLLGEFNVVHGMNRPTILGVREHVFTGSVSSLAWFMSNQETSFVTLGQRVLARPLKVRMHYGHPDVFDRLFHLTRGGISKASKTINVSEDIFAGFNSTLRKGNITHHEYIQVGKGRDVGLNQIAMFEAKVSSGNAEQLLSRDVYRLGQLFDFFRMLSFYVTAVGYYVCTMMTTLVVYVFLYGRVYMALSGVGQALKSISQNSVLQEALDTQFLYQIGIFTAIPMLIVFLLEQGAFRAIVNFITMQLQLCSVFFTFSLGTRSHYFGQTVLHGGAKYYGTGRDFVVQHIKFAHNYQLYSRSHFVKALEIVMLLLVIRAYGYYSSTLGYILFSMFSWFLAISWLFAPFIFNPSCFEWQKTVEDFDDWTNWLFYRAGVGVKTHDSWEVWWNEGYEHIRSPVGRVLEVLLSLRFFIFQFGVVYHLKAAHHSLSLNVYGVSWLVFAGIILIFLIFSFGPKSSINYQMFLRLVQGMVFIIIVFGLIAVVVLRLVTPGDIFASLLALIPTGWGILSIAIACKPLVKSMGLWKSVRAIAWGYDAAMGMIIFLPIAILSWFPFVSTFQTRLLFNQAFSRGLEISLILAGNRPTVQ